MIQAMPRILSRHSDVVYIIAGATHPHVRRREGDQYRLQLEALAKELGVEENVVFHNRFFSPQEMASLVGLADIYVTPYRYVAQAVSGTLAYALGAGKAIISTPYWYAAELLGDGRGALVPFDEPDAIADTAIELLDNCGSPDDAQTCLHLCTQHGLGSGGAVLHAVLRTCWGRSHATWPLGVPPSICRAQRSRLLSVNVGLPREVAWNGKTVRTGIWKFPVKERRMVRKLNIDGDWQGDLAGHGGEQRAVFVYQIDSYHYWERFLGRDDFSFGQFGEKLHHRRALR